MIAAAPWLSGQSNWTVTGEFGTEEFNNGDNWSAGVPGSGVQARFTNNATGVITLDTDLSTGELFFANTSGALSFDFGSNKLTGTGRLGIDAGGSSNVVHFVGGKYDFTAFDIGGTTGDSHTVTISGPSTELTGSGSMIVRYSNKSLTVSDGAKLTMDGNDSRFGQNHGGNNTMTITGTNSSASFANILRLGFQSTNSVIHVLEGGVLNAPQTYIGDQKADSKESKMLISGTGSQLNATNNVMFRGIDGELLIENGGKATAGNFRINATTETSNNTAHVTGSTSELKITGDAYIGYAATSSGATLRISDGGKVNVDGFVQLGISETGTGNLLLVDSGGSLTVNGSNGLILANNGELRLDDGTVTAEKVFFHPGNRLVGSGNLILGNTPAANRVAALGTGSGREIIIGGESDFGLLNVVGSWENSGLDLFMKLGDFSGNQAIAGDNFDQLLLSGNMTSGGTLFIDLENYVASSIAMEILLIGWDQFVGDEGDFAISFSGIDPTVGMPDFRSDGLYIVIPEPSAWAYLPALGLVALLVMRGFRKGRAGKH